ncbi:hypothetical protein JCGZ_19661 [Jatropha curcas]|uniref:Uncharacterized protein n=1 Tax=Jatropha curcas TaxID=180498 RepID=A0A067K1N6_JATCU|nr:hypothetical protein JCGZ_19661 [Jatropha curcas]
MEEPEKTEKGKKVEEGSDTETENLEISDEDKTEQESKLLSAQRSRKLATLRVKGTTYIPSSEKPKNVKHTVGKHRTHGKKPPLHPSSKRLESPFETAPAQPLRSSKRLRTSPKPL